MSATAPPAAPPAIAPTFKLERAIAVEVDVEPAVWKAMPEGLTVVAAAEGWTVIEDIALTASGGTGSN